MLLPIFLFGNLHCFGMCGPLVMLLGEHRCRYAYFIGRTLSFTLMGGLAGALGMVIDLSLKQFHLSALFSLLCGGLIALSGLLSLLSLGIPLPKKFGMMQQTLSLWLLKDSSWPIFLFGFFTVFFPCGQTLIVFSSCALAADALSGLFNGFLFSLATSPSLFFAMRALSFLRRFKSCYPKAIGLSALLIGALALCRGFAEMEWIPHLILNPNSRAEHHIVLF